MKKYFLITVVFYAVFLTFASYSVSKAFFADMAVSTANSFTAANEFPTASTSATPTPTGEETPTIAPDTTDHLVISEVQITGGAGNTSHDFVEIYNPTNAAVDLNNWKIRKRTSRGTETSLVLFTTGNSIPAHGFFLWANSDGGFNASVSANISNGNTLAADNNIALELPNNKIVDQVAWGTGTTQFIEGTAFASNPIANQSIERKAHSTSDVTSMISGVDANKGNGFDGNNNSTDFILRAASQPQNSGSAAELP